MENQGNENRLNENPPVENDKKPCRLVDRQDIQNIVVDFLMKDNKGRAVGMYLNVRKYYFVEVPGAVKSPNGFYYEADGKQSLWERVPGYNYEYMAISSRDGAAYGSARIYEEGTDKNETLMKMEEKISRAYRAALKKWCGIKSKTACCKNAEVYPTPTMLKGEV
jgi:hypothetical protein